MSNEAWPNQSWPNDESSGSQVQVDPFPEIVVGMTFSAVTGGDVTVK